MPGQRGSGVPPQQNLQGPGPVVGPQQRMSGMAMPFNRSIGNPGLTTARPGAVTTPGGPSTGSAPSTFSAGGDPLGQMYKDAMGQFDKTAANITEMGQNNIAALQRRNGSMAAMAGRGIGGGYLGGQRAMLSQGMGSLANSLQQNDQARQGAMMSYLGRKDDQAFQGKMRDEDWAREDTIREATAKADISQKQRGAAGDKLRDDFKKALGNVPSWVEANIQNYLATGDQSLMDAIQKAIDDQHGRDSTKADVKQDRAAFDETRTSRENLIQQLMKMGYSPDMAKKAAEAKFQ